MKNTLSPSVLLSAIEPEQNLRQQLWMDSF